MLFTSSAIYQQWLHWSVVTNAPELQLWHFKYGIKFERDSSKFFQTVYCSPTQASSKTARSKMWILESVKNGVNDTDIISCADKQTFGADIKVPTDIVGCTESKSVRCLYRILLMWSVKCQITLFSRNSHFWYPNLCVPDYELCSLTAHKVKETFMLCFCCRITFTTNLESTSRAVSWRSCKCH